MMLHPIFIAGEAGAGKTRKLMERAAICGSELITSPHQRALAMAVMHGARRQLQLAIGRFCPKLPVTVSTIHSFALAIVNRWRRSLRLSAPVMPCEASCGLAEKHLRTQATFDEVMELACRLLESPTVRRTLGESYPVVIVDEFQDCTATTLRFVTALGSSARLVLAADEFQMLQDGVAGCPALDWAHGLREKGDIEYEDLTGCRRTDNPLILQAARALRDNVRATSPTVPVYHAPMPGAAACRIVERFAGWGHANQIAGTCALIALSMDDVLLHKLLESFKAQLAKRNTKRKVHWSQVIGEGQQQKQLLAELGIATGGRVETAWDPNQIPASKRASAVAQDVVRFSKLRGIAPIPQDLTMQFAKLAVHRIRAFGRSSPRFQVLTVHAAKNREFDHVFVFWGYKNAAWSVEQQRRLLYNAVTRAKTDCTVLVLGDKRRAEEDPVISLLSGAQPAIDPAWQKRSKKSVERRSRPAR